MSYVPTYSEVDTSDFALKTNVAEIKNKVDDIDVDKINSIDERQGKYYIEDSYLYFKPEHRYFDTAGIKSVLSWKSIGLSDEKLKSMGDEYFPETWCDKERTYLNF